MLALTDDTCSPWDSLEIAADFASSADPALKLMARISLDLFVIMTVKVDELLFSFPLLSDLLPEALDASMVCCAFLMVALAEAPATGVIPSTPRCFGSMSCRAFVLMSDMDWVVPFRAHTVPV